jgi:hypothetical protein
LHALGFEVSAYHMNEGHSALLGIELLRRFTYPESELRGDESPYDVPRVRSHLRTVTRLSRPCCAGGRAGAANGS